MLSVAFKEWAVICAALASGKQSLILRKGGIAEEGGGFKPEHSEFLLYPTYFHEHRNGISRILPLLEKPETAKPPVELFASRTSFASNRFRTSRISTTRRARSLRMDAGRREAAVPLPHSGVIRAERARFQLAGGGRDRAPECAGCKAGESRRTN